MSIHNYIRMVVLTKHMTGRNTNLNFQIDVGYYGRDSNNEANQDKSSHRKDD